MEQSKKEELKLQFEDWYEKRTILNFGIDSDTTESSPTPQMLFDFFFKIIESQEKELQQVSELGSMATSRNLELEHENACLREQLALFVSEDDMRKILKVLPNLNPKANEDTTRPF